MGEIKELIKSPAFWFASVIIAFFMSFFASYAKDWINTWFKSRSIRKIRAAKARQDDFELRVSKLKNNPELISIYQNNIIYQKIRQAFYLTAVLVCMAFMVNSAANLDFIAAAMTGLFGLFIYWRQRDVSEYLYELISVINEVLDDEEYHFKG